MSYHIAPKVQTEERTKTTRPEKLGAKVGT